MRKTNFLFLLSLLTMFMHSCKDDIAEISEGNKKTAEVKLPKYPNGAVVIKGDESNYLQGFYNSKSLQTRTSFFVKDSVWFNGKGHSLIYETNEHGVTDDVMRYIYLGSLLKGGSIETQRFAPISKQVEPVAISYSFPARWVTDVIQRPSLGSMRQSVRNIMEKEGMNGNQIVSFSYDMKEFTYYSEVKMAFGCNINVAKVLNIGVDVAKDKIRGKTGLIAKFIQKNFTLDLDIPMDGNLLLNNNDINSIGQYDPVYISSIVYGRMGVITIDSEESYDKLRVALKATLEAKVVKGSLDVSYENTEILRKSQIAISIISGDGQGAVKAVSGFEEFKKFLIEGGRFTKEVPGDPLFYTASYLSDNSPYFAKFRVDIEY